MTKEINQNGGAHIYRPNGSKYFSQISGKFRSTKYFKITSILNRGLLWNGGQRSLTTNIFYPFL